MVYYGHLFTSLGRLLRIVIYTPPSQVSSAAFLPSLFNTHAISHIIPKSWPFFVVNSSAELQAQIPRRR